MEMTLGGRRLVNAAGLDRQAFKEKYLAFFPLRSSSAVALQEAVRNLVALGVSRSTLIKWGVSGGYSVGYVRSQLCRIFCALGLRDRRPGAGRKPSSDALELLAHARDRYGDRSRKVLYAAWRAAKAQLTAAVSLPQSPVSGGYRPIVRAQLGHAGVNGHASNLRPVAIISTNQRRINRSIKTPSKPL